MTNTESEYDVCQLIFISETDQTIQFKCDAPISILSSKSKYFEILFRFNKRLSYEISTNFSTNTIKYIFGLIYKFDPTEKYVGLDQNEIMSAIDYFMLNNELVLWQIPHCLNKIFYSKNLLENSQKIIDLHRTSKNGNWSTTFPLTLIKLYYKICRHLKFNESLRVSYNFVRIYNYYILPFCVSVGYRTEIQECWTSSKSIKQFSLILDYKKESSLRCYLEILKSSVTLELGLHITDGVYCLTEIRCFNRETGYFTYNSMYLIFSNKYSTSRCYGFATLRQTSGR